MRKQERECKVDGRSFGSDRGVEQAGYGRADLPLGLGGHRSSRCRRSLFEALRLRCFSVYSLPCFSLTVCPPKDVKHGCSSPSEPDSPWAPTTEWGSLRPSRSQFSSVQFISVAQSCPTLGPHESQHARPPCPSPAPGVHSDSRPSSQ